MSAGGIDVVFRADTSSIETAAGKVETLSKRAADAVQRAADRQVADNNRFIQSVQRQADTLGLSGAAMLRYEANARGVSTQLEDSIKKIEQFTAAQKTMASAANSDSFKAVAEGANSASHATAGMTRELIVLAHEASQGNIKRLGGSLLVIAEYSTAAQAAIRSLAGPIGIVVGALGLFALAMYEGAKASDTLHKSLILTGNYAGVTAGGFEKLTHSVSEATGSTLTRATEALQALVSTGEVGPAQMQKMGEATVKLMDLSGKSAEEIAKDFAKMAEGPTKWAAEANRAYNFLTAPQYDYIKRLEEQGKKEEAEMEVINRLNEHLGQQIPAAMGSLSQALRDGALLWDKFWHAALHAGAPETIEDQLASVEKRLKNNFDSSGKFVSQNFVTSSTSQDGSKRSLELQRDTLLHDQLRQSETALTTATQERYAKAGIAASDYFSKLQEERKGTDRLKKDLDELQANIQKRIDGGGPKSLPEDAENEAYIRHRDRSFQDKDGDRAAKQLDTRYQDRLEALRAEGIKLDEAAKNWKLYGKSIEDSHLALVNLEIAQGKLKGLSPDKIANLQSVAASDDAKAKQNEQEKAQDKLAKELDDRVKKISAASDAQALNSRQVELANELAQAEHDGLKKNTAAWDDFAKSIGSALNKRDDQKSLEEMTAYGKKVDADILKMQEETASLKQGALAHLQMAEAIKIEAQARKLKDGTSPETQAAIDAQAAIQKAKSSAAISDDYDTRHSFDFGSQQAFKKYQESASDAASFGEKMMTGSFQHIEDSLMNFVDKGKLSFTSLFKFMADEFIRNAIRMSIAGIGSAMGGGGGGAGGLLGGLLGSMSGNTGGIGDKYNSGETGISGLMHSLGGIANSIGGAFGGSGLSISTAADGAEGAMGISAGYSAAADSALADLPALATGTNYVPYDGMAAVLHKGEAVVPAAYNPAAGGKSGAVDASFNGNVSVGQGVSRGEVNAAIGQALGVHEKRIRRLNRQGALT